MTTTASTSLSRSGSPSAAEKSSRLTDVDGTLFHTDEAGAGPVLIALHGGGPGANAWDNTGGSLAALAERFHVILLDLPGFGGSVRGPGFAGVDGESEDRVYARSLLAFMDARGIERAHLFGASMSGGCVLRLAIEHPDRVDRLVLKAPGGMPNPFGPSPAPGIRAMLDYMREPSREAMAKVVHLFVPHPDRFSEAMVDARFEAAQRTPYSPPAGPHAAMDAELGAVEAPTLVLWGRDDQMVPFAGVLPLLDRVRDVRLHAWGAGTGHFVEWEHPEEFTRVVLDFLDA